MLATYSVVISSARSLRTLLHKGYSPSKLSPSLPRLPLELQKQLLVLHVWRHGHHLGVAMLHQPRVHKGAVLPLIENFVIRLQKKVMRDSPSPDLLRSYDEATGLFARINQAGIRDSANSTAMTINPSLNAMVIA